MFNFIFQYPISPIQDLLKFLPPSEISLSVTNRNLNKVLNEALISNFEAQGYLRELRWRLREELLKDAINEVPIRDTLNKYKCLLATVNRILKNHVIEDSHKYIQLDIFVLREGIKLRLGNDNYMDVISYLSKVLNNYNSPDALIALLSFIPKNSYRQIFEYVKSNVKENIYNLRILQMLIKYLQNNNIDENVINKMQQELQQFKLPEFKKPLEVKIELDIDSSLIEKYKDFNSKVSQIKHSGDVTEALQYFNDIFANLNLEINLKLADKILKNHPEILTKQHFVYLIKFAANSTLNRNFHYIFKAACARSDLFDTNLQNKVISLLNLTCNIMLVNTLDLLIKLVKCNLIKITFIQKLYFLFIKPDANAVKEKVLELLFLYLNQNPANIKVHIGIFKKLLFGDNNFLLEKSAMLCVKLFIFHPDKINRDNYPDLYAKLSDLLHRNCSNKNLNALALFPGSPFLNTYEAKINFPIKYDRLAIKSRFFNNKVNEEVDEKRYVGKECPHK